MSSVADMARRIIPGGKLGRGVAVLAGGSALAQVIGILASPITTRLYTPADFGAAAVYASLLSLLTIVASGRYELAIPLPKDDHSALDLVVLALAATLAMSALFAAGLWFLGDWLLRLTDSQSLRPYLWLLPVAVVGGGIYQTMNFWSTRRKSYRRLAQTRLNQSASSAAVSIGVGSFHSGPLGLLLASIVAQTAGISTLAGDALRVAREGAFRLSPARLWRAACSYRQFPMYSCLAGLLNTAGITLPSLLLSSFYGPEITGLFGLAFRVTSLPMSLVGLAVGQVFIGEAAHILRDSPQQLRSFFDRVTVRLLPLCLIVAAIGAVSPFVFGFVFGAKFAPAGLYAAFLAISCSAQLVVSPISAVTILVKRQDIQLVFDALRVVLVLAALCIPPLAGASGTFTVAAYAVMMAIMYLLYFIMYRRLTGSVAKAEGV